MAGFHLYRPKNGSGKKSEFWSYHFSIRGQLVRGATGERDRGKAEVEAAKEFLDARRRASLPVPREALRQFDGKSLAELGGMFVSHVEDLIEKRAIVRSDKYASDLEGDLCYIVHRFKGLEEITSTSWRETLNDWHAGYPEARKSGARSWRYLQRVTVTARALLRYANRMGLLEVVPEIDAPSGDDVALEQTQGRPLPERQRDQFLAALRRLGKTRPGARRALRIYTALLWSALRKSALERLCLRQVRFQEKRIELPPRKSKSRRERSISLHPRVERAIRDELRARGRIAPDEPIFGKFDLRAWFAEALTLAKIDRDAGLQPHHFTRHTTATIAGNRGASLAQLMALGTWETPAMAMRYVKIDAERSREALDLVDEPRVKVVRKKRSRSGG